MWDYKEAGHVLTIGTVYSDDCIYCRNPLFSFKAAKFEVKQKRLLA